MSIDPAHTDPRANGRSGREAAVTAFGVPCERDGTTVITATHARTHTAVRAPAASGKGRRLDAGMAGSRPLGAFVLRDGRVRWHPAVDATKVVTTAELVLGAVLVAQRLAARPAGAKALVTMGPGGWVSMKGGAMAVRPAERAWLRRRAAVPAPERRPWWARLLSAKALESLLR